MELDTDPRIVMLEVSVRSIVVSDGRSTEAVQKRIKQLEETTTSGIDAVLTDASGKKMTFTNGVLTGIED